MVKPAELARLYAVPPSEFVAARDALSAELKARGDESAAEVKKLRRPNAVLWAANQLARRAPKAVKALLEAAAAMRGAAGDALRDATQAERDQLRVLTHEGERALEESGHAPNASTTRELYALLHAAAAGDEATRAALAEGALTGPPEAPSLFGELSASVRAGKPPAREPKREREPERERDREREREQAKHEAKKLRAVADKLAERATAARRRSDDAQRSADELRRAAAVAEGEADEARRAAERAEKRLAD
jgi:hypothetical protein